MAELKCPHCGQVFTVDGSELDSIVKQIRDGEFRHDVDERVAETVRSLTEKHEIELKAKEADVRLKTQEQHEKELAKLREELQKVENQKQALQAQVDAADDKQRLAVQDAVKKLEDKNQALESEKKELQLEIQQNENLRELAVRKAVDEIKDEKQEIERKLISEKEKYDAIVPRIILRSITTRI